VFTRSGAAWSQQGAKLLGSGESGLGQFGSAAALSADGNTAVIGGPFDDGSTGAAWVFGAPAIASPPNLDFGSQTTGRPGTVGWLPLVNSGEGRLTFSGPAQIAGPNASDFAIPAGDDRCNGATLDLDEVCWIGVQLTAAAAGPLTATLTFGANDTYRPSPTVSLTGTGIAPDSGPSGSQGPSGPAGPGGPLGATGPPGRSGTLVLVAYEASVSSKRVVISYALTGPADITLAVARKKGQPVIVARGHGRAGVNKLPWNRKLAGKRAKPGAYQVLLTGTANGKTATSRLKVRLR
jgi:hypothetical protein